MDFLNDAGRVNVGGGNGFGAVLHPERGLERSGKNKNHRVAVLDVRAEHHARLLLALGERLFGVENLCADVKFDGREFRLRVRGQRHPEGRSRLIGGGLRLPAGILRIFAARQQRGGSQQREKIDPFHPDTVPESAGIFNLTVNEIQSSGRSLSGICCRQSVIDF